MDKNYWESYYAQQNAIMIQSPFAEYVAKNLIAICNSLIDLGCGNGRDAIYFANVIKMY
ncbi:MAG: hypothetical protein IPI46_13990 [Bacteroidetes bacterium]|nr:hypothetical protein [Bacteroidota bacterium]